VFLNTVVFALNKQVKKQMLVANDNFRRNRCEPVFKDLSICPRSHL